MPDQQDNNHPHFPGAKAGAAILSLLEVGGLVIIAIATLIAGAQEVLKMVDHQVVTLADLLLLFIYLEVLAMIGVYLKSGSLPIRMPMYIAIVALARHMILDMKEMTEWEIIATAVSILIIAASVLVIRFGHVRFPYPKNNRPDNDSH